MLGITDSTALLQQSASPEWWETALKATVAGAVTVGTAYAEQKIAERARPPAQVSEPSSASGAATPAPMQRAMNPTLKAALVIGGLVITVVVLAAFAPRLFRKG